MSKYWNELSKNRSDELVKSVIKVITDNLYDTAKLVIDEASKGNYDFLSELSTIIDLVLKENYSDVIVPFKDIAALVCTAAKKGDENYFLRLLICYISSPRECENFLTECLGSYVPANDRISSDMKFAIGFCFTFGISVRIDHSKATEFLENSGNHNLMRILLKFLRLKGEVVKIPYEKARREFADIESEFENMDKCDISQCCSAALYYTLKDAASLNKITIDYIGLTFKSHLMGYLPSDENYFIYPKLCDSSEVKPIKIYNRKKILDKKAPFDLSLLIALMDALVVHQ